MSDQEAYRYINRVDYLGDLPGAEREGDVLKVNAVKGTIDLEDRAARALGRVTVTGTPIEDALASEGLDHLLVGQTSGATWDVEQQTPVAIEDTAGTQIDPATEGSLTSTLSREIAVWTAGTLPVEQQTPVGVENSSGTQVSPATEPTLSALAAALASNGGDTLLVDQQGVVDISSRDGRNLGDVDVTALPDEDSGEYDQATLGSGTTEKIALSATGVERLRGTVVSTGSYDVVVSWQTSAGTEISTTSVATGVAGGTPTDIDLPATSPHAVVQIVEQSGADQTFDAVAHLA